MMEKMFKMWKMLIFMGFLRCDGGMKNGKDYAKKVGIMCLKISSVMCSTV